MARDCGIGVLGVIKKHQNEAFVFYNKCKASKRIETEFFFPLCGCLRSVVSGEVSGVLNSPSISARLFCPQHLSHNIPDQNFINIVLMNLFVFRIPKELLADISRE